MTLDVVFRQRASDPFDARFAFFVERDRGNVDSHARDFRHACDAAFPKRSDAAQERSSFRVRNACERFLERARPARPYFDDDDEIGSLRDDVELERPDTEIPPEDPKAVREKEIGRRLLGDAA